MFNIALNTFREIIRNRFFSLIIFLSIALIALSMTLDSLALGENKRVIVDFGLSFLELSGFAVILFLGGGMIAREIEGRTIYLMLSKPIHRGEIIIGKFIGFMGVLGVIFGIELSILMILFSLQGVALDMILILVCMGIAMKLLALLALSLFFSTLVSPGLALFLTIASNIIGHGGYIVLEYAQRTGNMIYHILARVILSIFPNLESINIKNLVATSAPIDIHTFLIALGLTGGYTLIVLMFAAWIFEKKSFDTV